MSDEELSNQTNIFLDELKRGKKLEDILPYAFALGVSDVWIDKFENINIQAPNWYESKDIFDFRSLGVFLTATMASLYMHSM